MAKECNSCKKLLDYSNFAKNKASKDGYQYRCKQCDNEYQRKRRIQNRESILDYSRKYQQNRRNNFEYRLQMLLNSSKQRAEKFGREHTITLEDVKQAFPKDNKCPVFKTELNFGNSGFREDSPSIDRIDSSRGYTKDNIQIVSWKANRIKGYATLEDLETLVDYMRKINCRTM